MISSKRLQRAEREGKEAYKHTGGNHKLVEVRYQMWSAQHKRFNKGWKAWKERFPFLMSTKVIR